MKTTRGEYCYRDEQFLGKSDGAGSRLLWNWLVENRENKMGGRNKQRKSSNHNKGKKHTFECKTEEEGIGWIMLWEGKAQWERREQKKVKITDDLKRKW